MMPRSREWRDTAWLLVCIAAAVLPHAPHLPLWCSALTCLVLLWRGALAWRQAPLPGRWTLLAALLLILGLTWATHRTLLGREAGITLLAMLMALKTLELRARRDAFVVFFLGFFLVLTQFLYSQSLLTALLAMFTVWGLLSQLVLAQLAVSGTGADGLGGPTPWRMAMRQAGRHLLLGAPLMVLLFMLFPRLPPLWGLPSQSSGKTGLSGSLQMGEIAEIAQDESIALRLRFEGRAPPLEQLYLRGPVLRRFDGRNWQSLSEWTPSGGNPSALAQPMANPAPSSWPGTITYTLTLEPLRLPLLPLLDYSPAPTGSRIEAQGYVFKRAPDGQWSADRAVTERLRVQHMAVPKPIAGTSAPEVDLMPDLRLPRGLNPRSLAWARALAQEPRFALLGPEQRPIALAEALLQHIRQQPYVYTLRPGRYGELTPHLIDEFWMDRRLGFCEHFASAFVVLMRGMGVPARLVTGFQGADPQLQDGDVVVRMRQAHAWAEYWVGGRGWLRADPTAAIAPERVIEGLTLAGAPEGLARLSPTAWRWLRNQWEWVDKRWGDWVLNYAQPQQFDLLRRLGWRQPDWQALGQLIAATLAGLGLAGAAWAWWRGRTTEPWQRQQRFIIQQLRRLGLSPAPSESLGRWIQQLEAGGPQAMDVAALLRVLEQQRYAQPADHGHAVQGLSPADGATPHASAPIGHSGADTWAWRWQLWRAVTRASQSRRTPNEAEGGS